MINDDVFNYIRHDFDAFINVIFFSMSYSTSILFYNIHTSHAGEMTIQAQFIIGWFVTNINIINIE